MERNKKKTNNYGQKKDILGGKKERTNKNKSLNYFLKATENRNNAMKMRKNS